MPLVTLRSYRDTIDAELAKARLESAGISAVIVDQHLASIQWLYSRAIGGVKVKVDESDLQGARQALREDRSADLLDIPESQFPPAAGDHCPACGSSDVAPSRLQRNAAAISLATGLPLIAWRRRWVCGSCNHSWKRARSGKVDVPWETLEAEKQVHERHPYPVARLIAAVLLGLAVLYYVQLQIRGSQ
jgi:hypothetical protein